MSSRNSTLLLDGVAVNSHIHIIFPYIITPFICKKRLKSFENND